MPIHEGEAFGKWTVMQRSVIHHSHWLCKCICGKERIIPQPELTSGHTTQCRSCAMKVAALKHGRFGTPEYKSWAHMMGRCYNKRNPDYKDYGGRGIVVCDEWKASSNFLRWADTSGYAPGLTIERINNDGNYCPENCKWITNEQQARNRRSNHWITVNGQTKLMIDWAAESGINYDALRWRVSAGWPVNELLAPSNSLSRRRKNGKRGSE